MDCLLVSLCSGFIVGNIRFEKKNDYLRTGEGCGSFQPKMWKIYGGFK